MSEEMRPQEPEEQQPGEQASAPAETQPVQAGQVTPVPQDGTSEAETQDAPAEHKILGMPALMFRSVAVGFAVGLILTGLLRLSGNYIPVILCAGAGWLVGRELEKRRKQKKD